MATPTTDSLLALLHFQGAPKAFWEAWLAQCVRSLQGQQAVLYTRVPGADPMTFEAWKVWGGWTGTPTQVWPELSAWVESSSLSEAVHFQAHVAKSRSMHTVALLHLALDASQELMLCVQLSAHAPGGEQAVAVLRQLALLPQGYQLTREKGVALREATRYSETLVLLGRVLESPNFEAASLAVVNELTDRYACEQVALLWMHDDGLQLRRLSHSDKIERRSALTALLEEAGQEALIQRTEIAWPTRSRAVSLAHQRYVQARQPGHMITLPLTWNDQALGALVCERAALAFSQSETWALRLVADQLSRPLRDLERAQAPWWKRLGREFASWLPQSLRPQTSEGKRFTQWAALALAVVLLVPFPYSIEAKFVMKTDAMAFVGAPFDGYIESSNVSLGLPVKAGQVLFVMSTKELLLERSAALADLSQIGREVERRRAANQLAEMRIAEAQYAQTQSKLEQTEFRLASASASAPIAGVVVEGEPGKNLGGAVKRGEMVVKVASVERLYAEFAVSESDVRLVKPQQSAHIRMVAHPANTWDMTVTRATPAPSVKEGGNTFPVRAEAAEEPPDWWRPGMSGTGRIEVGYRNLLWRATHRLVDYLRLRIWFI